MNCPRCQSHNFAPFSHEAVEFDFCSDCLGIWWDRGELAQYVETIEDLPKNSAPSTLESEINCPKCSGLWLDSKELGLIQKYARNIDADKRIERTLEQMKKQGFQIS